MFVIVSKSFKILAENVSISYLYQNSLKTGISTGRNTSNLTLVQSSDTSISRQFSANTCITAPSVATNTETNSF